MLVVNMEPECFAVEAVHVAFVQLDVHIPVNQLLPKCRQGVSWPVEVAPGMGEAEDDVASCILVEMRKQLLDAEPEDHGQPGIVGLEQDADAMDLLDVGNVAEDAVEVLLVLLDAPGVSDARSVDDVDQLVDKRKGVSSWLLSCRLSFFQILIVRWLPNVDVLTLAGVCGEGELRWDRCDHLEIVFWGHVYLSGESVNQLLCDVITCSEAVAD